MQHLTVTELANWLAQTDVQRPPPILLDVREDWEIQTCALPGIQHMPMRSVPTRASELDEDANIVCICHHGMRSLQVANWLTSQGFANVHNLTGGMDAWARQIDPGMPVY